MALFFTYLLPLLLPTVIYLLWRLITPRRASPAGGGAETSAAEGTGADTSADSAAAHEDPWRDAPWLWLAIAGLALLVVVLLFGAFVHGSPQRGQYLPPRMENGQIVPGELRPFDSGAERPGGSVGGAR